MLLFMHLCNFRNVHVSIQSFQKLYIFCCVPLFVFKRSPAYQGTSSSSKEPACKWDQIHLKLRCQYYPKEPQLWMEYCYLQKKKKFELISFQNVWKDRFCTLIYHICLSLWRARMVLWPRFCWCSKRCWQASTLDCSKNDHMHST